MTRLIKRRSALRTIAGAGAATLAAPHIASAQGQTTTWRIQTSWPGGAGLQIFKDWCATIVEKTGGELEFQPFGANDVVGDFQLYDAVRNGVLEAVNPFTIYAQGIIPAATFLTSYPLALRNPHEWDVFYYGLGGLDIARELYAEQGMHFVGPVHHGPNIIHSKVPIRSIDDFRGRKMRLPGGMVAEVFTEIGAETTVLPGSEIFPALERGTIDVADYVGPAVNYALGFSQVTSYISMGPPGFMSLYQPVDLMDITVGMDAWNALSPQMQQFVEMETHVYSDMHHAAIQKADQEAWGTLRGRWRGGDTSQPGRRGTDDRGGGADLVRLRQPRSQQRPRLQDPARLHAVRLARLCGSGADRRSDPQPVIRPTG